MATLEQTIAAHKSKLWLGADFDHVMILPLRKEVNKAWIGQPQLFLNPVTKTPTAWYAPTDAFWRVHAHASHPGPGDLHGCSSKIHTAFLTATGKNAEFMYGYVRKSDGYLIVETEKDFEAECAWWAKNFPLPAQGGAATKAARSSFCTGGCCGGSCSCAASCPCRQGGGACTC